MTKQIKEVPIDYDFDWSDTNTIEKIKEDIEQISKLGATHIKIDAYDYLRFSAFTRRLETDEEYEERIKEFEKKEQAATKKEKEMLDYLLKKYNKG